MNAALIYKFMSKLYDLLDIVYFCDEEASPRKAVYEAVNEKDCILDLCTGTATNAIKIAKGKPGVKLIAVDRSKEMLKVASGKLKKEHLKNVRLYAMDATKLKFKSNCFDKVLLSLVLHELEDDLADKILKEASRVLKEGGELIVMEWEPVKKGWRKFLFMPIPMLEPKSYRAFIKKDLHKYFKRYGLEVVSITHCSYTKVLRIRK